jgi:hypothetical protein
MPVVEANIPARLKAFHRWVGWRWTWNGRKWDKPPLTIAGANAASNDPGTWSGLQNALAAYQRGDFDGIGFVLGRDKESGVVFSGVDLDKQVNPNTGELTSEAAYLICQINSYAERSPSWEEAKVFTLGDLPRGRRADHARGLEMYAAGRYFTVTGHRLEGVPADVEERTEALRTLHALLFADKQVRARARLSDPELALAALRGLSKQRAVGYWDWLGVGMVLHSVDPSPSMLADWDEWSRACPEKYQDGACEKKWASFSGRGLGLGSLIYWARQDGWTPPRTLRPLPSQEHGEAKHENGKQEGSRPDIEHTLEGMVYKEGALAATVSKQRTRWQVIVARGEDVLGTAVLHLADIKGRRDLLRSLRDVAPAEREALEKLLLRLATLAERDWQEHLRWHQEQHRATGQEQLEQQAAAATAAATAAREKRQREIEPVALAVLGDPALLHHIAEAIADRGGVGERANALILYLAVLSQVTAAPISVVVKGDSAGGKSHLVGQVLVLFPADCHIDFSSMSDKAMLYDQRSYSHKTIVIFEVHGQGSEFSNYIIRTLVSEGCIRHQTVETTPHGLVPREIVKEGPTNFITTTTFPELHAENETRVWTILVDDSPSTTKQVLVIQAKRASGGFQPKDVEYLRIAVEWLKLAGATEAVVPYAELLSAAMPDRPLRLRRDFPRLLLLIQVVTLVHQRQRARDDAGRVVATLADYAMVRALVLPTFARTIMGMTEKTTELVEALEGVLEEKIANNNVKPADARVSYSDLVKETGKPKYYITRWLQPALEIGLVDNTNAGERGRPAVLKMGHYTLEDGDVLPTVRELAEQLNSNVEWIDPLTGQRQVVQVLQSHCNTTPPGGGVSQTVNGQQVGTGTTPGDRGVAVLQPREATQFSPPPSAPPPPMEKILALPPAATLQHCNTGHFLLWPF